MAVLAFAFGGAVLATGSSAGTPYGVMLMLIGLGAAIGGVYITRNYGNFGQGISDSAEQQQNNAWDDSFFGDKRISIGALVLCFLLVCGMFIGGWVTTHPTIETPEPEFTSKMASDLNVTPDVDAPPLTQEEIVAKIEDWAEEKALSITDVGEVDGSDLLRRLQEVNPETLGSPIVLCGILFVPMIFWLFLLRRKRSRSPLIPLYE